MQALGYDIETGLRYAAADRSFYLELVRMFADGSEDGILAIRKDYEEHDIRDYQIRVHALKSTARQIGAKKLSDLALSQENAAKEGDLEAIRDGVDELLGAYEAAGRELKAVADASQASSPAAPDEVQDDLEVSGTAHCIDAGEAESILREAAAAIDDFEEERAARLLKPLMEVSARGIPLHEPVREILDALDDFDPGTAAGTIKTLLERMADQD